MVSTDTLGRCSGPAAALRGPRGSGISTCLAAAGWVFCPHLEVQAERKSEGKAPLEFILPLCQVWRLPWGRWVGQSPALLPLLCQGTAPLCALCSCQLPPVCPCPHTMAQASCLPLCPGHGTQPSSWRELAGVWVRGRALWGTGRGLSAPGEALLSLPRLGAATG